MSTNRPMRFFDIWSSRTSRQDKISFQNGSQSSENDVKNPPLPAFLWRGGSSSIDTIKQEKLTYRPEILEKLEKVIVAH